MLARRASAAPSERELLHRIEELEETIRQMHEVFAPPIAFPNDWKLTRSETTVLCALHAARGVYVRKEAIFTALYGLGGDPELQMVDVLICKLRKKLKPHGIEIETVYGRGYALSENGRGIVAASVEEGRAR